MTKTIRQEGGGKRSGTRLGVVLAAAIGANMLTGCGVTGGPYPGVPVLMDPSSIPAYTGPVAAPQVAYRIDMSRYFEIVPLGAERCTNGRIYYVDKAKGIRSLVMSVKELGGVGLIVDAANESVLVAPTTRGNSDCSSGGGFCGGGRLPYSTDAGRTWKRAIPGAYGGSNVYMSGQEVYTAGMSANLLEIAAGSSQWNDGLLSDFPSPVVAPVDSKFHCEANSKGAE